MGYTSKLLKSAGREKYSIQRYLNAFAAIPKHFIARIKMEKHRRQELLNIRNRDFLRQVSPDSLLFYWGNIHSQRGQDGILAEIFRRLGINSGLFVEFGAWDGVFLSNSRWLFEKGWRGVWIEADAAKYDALLSIYGDQTTNIQALVGAPSFGLAGDPLCEILKSNGVNLEDVTFLSIDVDGPDLDIFEDIGFAPPVILIEGGFNFIPTINERLPPEISWRFQQPLQVILDTAEKHGYDAVCFCQDTYLVRKDLSEPFLKQTSSTLYRDAYFFMTDDFRTDLNKTREDPRIVDIERKILGANRTSSPV